MRKTWSFLLVLSLATATGAGSAEPAAVVLSWRVETGAAVRSGPTVTDGSVFVGNAAGEVLRLHRDDGAVLWRSRCGGAVSSRPAVSGSRVVVTAQDGLYALDRTDGHLLWKDPAKTQPPHPLGWDYWVASPLVVGDRVYVGFGDGTFAAYELASGAVVWRRALGSRLRATAALAGDLLLVPAFDGRLYALDAADGHDRWQFDTAGVGLDPAETGFDRRSLQARPVVVDGTAFFGSRDGHMYAVDVATGSQRWRVDEEVSWVLGAVLPFHDLVIVPTSDGHRVHALDRASGAERWSHPLTARALVDLARLGRSMVVVGETTGILHGLDAATGTTRWRFFAGDTILSAPACAGHEIAFGSDDGAVYMLTVHPGRERDDHPTDRAVYYDEALPFRYSDHDRLVRDAFAAAGYEVVAAGDLIPFLAAHLDGARRAVLALATDVLPSTALAPDEAGVPLLRRFIAAGGRTVSFGAPPGLIRVDLATGKPAMASADELVELLGIRLRVRFGDNTPAAVTPAGTRRGLWGGLVGSWGAEPDTVGEVLATDAWGDAVAWRQELGKGEVIQLFGRYSPTGCLPAALNLVEAGLPPPA